MEKNNLLQELSKNRIFKDFATAQIEKILNHCQQKVIKANETLFSQGDQSDAIYFLISGQLKVNANQALISTIHDGGIVGEIGTITNTARSGTVIATHESQLLSLKQSDLNSIIESDSQLGLKLYRNVVEILAGYLVENNMALEFCKMIS